jgi:hypothetical protein
MGKQEMEQLVNWNQQVTRIDLDSRLFMDCDMEIEFLQGKKVLSITLKSKYAIENLSATSVLNINHKLYLPLPLLLLLLI